MNLKPLPKDEFCLFFHGQVKEKQNLEIEHCEILATIVRDSECSLLVVREWGKPVRRKRSRRGHTNSGSCGGRWMVVPLPRGKVMGENQIEKQWCLPPSLSFATGVLIKWRRAEILCQLYSSNPPSSHRLSQI